MLASVFLLGSYPGMSTGLAMVVVGLVVLMLGKTAPALSAELAGLLARTGYENLGRLLEELGTQSRAVYLPSSAVAGAARAMVPLGDGAWTSLDTKPLNDRFIVFYGEGADDVGLLVTAPGCAALGLLPYPPGATMDELTVAITQVAISSLRIARGVEMHEYGDTIEVTFVHESVPERWLSSVVELCLGSLSASIAAALVSEGRHRRVTVESETVAGSTRTVMLALLPQ